MNIKNESKTQVKAAVAQPAAKKKPMPKKTALAAESKAEPVKKAALAAESKAEPAKKATLAAESKAEPAKKAALAAESKADQDKKAEEPKPVQTKKKAASGKADPKPMAKKELQASIVIEYAGKQITAQEILNAAKKAYKSMNQGVVIETIEIYVKPEENAAYYVVNGKGSDQYKVVL